MRQVSCKCEKTDSIAVLRYIPFKFPEKLPHVSVKIFFVILHFCQIDAFPLGVFSIRSFFLHNII